MRLKIDRLRKSLVFLSFFILFGAQAVFLYIINIPQLIPYCLAADIFIIGGVYSFRGFDMVSLRNLKYTFQGFFTGALVVLVLMGIVLLIIGDPRAWFPLLITLPFIFLVIPLTVNRLFNSAVKRMKPKKYLVIGTRAEIEPILSEVSQALLGKITVVEYLNPSPKAIKDWLASEKSPDTVMIADPDLAKPVIPVIQTEAGQRVPVEYLPDLTERALKRIPLPLLEKFDKYYRVAFSRIAPSFFQRVMDVAIALTGLLLTLPITALLFIVIPLTSGFPIIFRQERIGYGMKSFQFYKFRSLRNPKHREESEHGANPNAHIESRKTLIGGLIRKLRFDEFPQFFNVLNNTMSVIGPRPEMETYHKQCLENIPWYSERYRLKPGITGWAQINYKHTSTMEDYIHKTEYDLYYIKNRTLILDLQIALKTLKTMLGMRGAV